MYRQFMQHLSDYDIDFSEVCMSKSRLLTFLGNEFGELLTSFCVDRNVGTIFHRTKADMHTLLSHTLHANSSCTAVFQAYETNLLNDQVHELVNHQKNESRDQSMKLAFDVDKFIATVRSIAPELWEHVRKLTQSVNERKGTVHFLVVSNSSVRHTLSLSSSSSPIVSVTPLSILYSVMSLSRVGAQLS